MTNHAVIAVAVISKPRRREPIHVQVGWKRGGLAAPNRHHLARRESREMICSRRASIGAAATQALDTMSVLLLEPDRPGSAAVGEHPAHGPTR